MNEFEAKIQDLDINPRLVKIKFKGKRESNYYTVAPKNILYAFAPKYLITHRKEREEMLTKGLKPDYFIAITNDNCEILDNIINPQITNNA